MAGYFSDLTEGGLQRKKERAAAGQAGPKTAQQLITAREAQALESGALEVSPEELEAQAAQATLGLGAVTQGTLQQLGPAGMPGTKFGKTMSDLQKFQKGIGEQVSAERMSGRALEQEIAEKRIADAKARITQAEQMRQGMVKSMTGAIVGGVLGAASLV